MGGIRLIRSFYLQRHDHWRIVCSDRPGNLLDDEGVARMTAGRKINLRSFEYRDLAGMVRWNNDGEVEAFVDCDLPKTLPECELWFQNNVPSRDYRIFAIEDRAGNLIGDLELDHISWRNGEAELRIRIGEKDYWNQGYGTDAVRSILRLALNELGLRRIYLKVYRFNTRAIRCYEKCGFRRQGVLKRRVKSAGDWKDIILMSLHYGFTYAARESTAASETDKT